MRVVNSPPCWARVVFPVLEDDFFYSDFFLEILAISHEKVKKTNRLNGKSYLAFSKSQKTNVTLVLEQIKETKLRV